MKTSAFENQMNKRAPRSRAILIAIAASVLFTTAALAQMPTSPWKKAAPFPEPDEELYGVACNGKMYVIGGWGDGKARGANYEYDSASDSGRRKSRCRTRAHAALVCVNGKIYVSGGFALLRTTKIPTGGAWQPIDDVWEYDPATDSWKRSRRCRPSAVLRWLSKRRQDLRDRRRYAGEGPGIRSSSDRLGF
jgi:N-acetylneuraminic acid mutarotase